MKDVVTQEQRRPGASSTTPELSVVVGLVDGRVDALRRSLRALVDQVDAPRLEILVPFDEPCRDVTRLADEFPEVRFVLAEGLDTWAARRGAGREHHDTLKTVGLRQACGEFVALTEDQAEVSPRWCRELVDLLQRNPEVSAIGGAMEDGGRGIVAHAMYLCDFGRYQNPLPEGVAHAISDANVVYRRTALEQVADAWRDDYHERPVHDALACRGLVIWQTPKGVTRQCRELGLLAALRERVIWGRSFAVTRGTTMTTMRRLAVACLAPLLPVVLTWRVLAGSLSRGRLGAATLRALPAVLLLNLAWSIGELFGGVTLRTAAAA